MTTPRDLERRLAEHLHGEAPSRAPDWILRSALTTIETTRQRRGPTAPWRNLDMPTFAKLGLAAAAVIAVGALALSRFAPPGPAAPSSPAASPSASPTAPRTLPPAPTAATYVPPALTETFTSDRHGLSLSYPEGWTPQPATEPWTASDPPSFGEPAMDFMYDPARDDHLFLELGSQPLGGTAFADWMSEFLAVEGCTMTRESVVDGADRSSLFDCNLVVAESGGRGYFIWLYTSGDDADLRSFDSAAFLEDVLATVQLQPADAVD